MGEDSNIGFSLGRIGNIYDSPRPNLSLYKAANHRPLRYYTYTDDKNMEERRNCDIIYYGKKNSLFDDCDSFDGAIHVDIGWMQFKEQSAMSG